MAIRREPDEEPTDELLFDWERLRGEALEWERNERRFGDDWKRHFPDGPDWERVYDYHRYGYVARRVYAEEPLDAVLERIRHGFERGEWETKDPWSMIEAALREGWNEAEGAQAARVSAQDAEEEIG